MLQTVGIRYINVEGIDWKPAAQDLAVVMSESDKAECIISEYIPDRYTKLGSKPTLAYLDSSTYTRTVNGVRYTKCNICSLAKMLAKI